MSRSRLSLLLLCCLLGSCLTIRYAAADVTAEEADAIVVAANVAADKVGERVHHDSNWTTAQDATFIRERRKKASMTKYPGSWMCEVLYGAQKGVGGLGDERIIAAAEVLLANPESDDELADVFDVLHYAQGDRHRIVAPTVRALQNPNKNVRERAADLLGQIGSRNEAPALVAMLSDNQEDVVWAAVAALAEIGGPKELIALDAWILRVTPDVKPKTLVEYKGLREEFADRLMKEGQLPPKEKP